MVFTVFWLFNNLRTVPPKSTVYTSRASWDGLRISDFKRTVATNSKVFLRGLRLRRKKKILGRGTGIQKENLKGGGGGGGGGNHASFRDN